MTAKAAEPRGAVKVPMSLLKKMKEYVKKSDITLMKFVTDAVAEKMQRETQV